MNPQPPTPASHWPLQYASLLTAIHHLRAPTAYCADRVELLQRSCRLFVEHGPMTLAWAGRQDALGRILPIAAAHADSSMEPALLSWLEKTCASLLHSPQALQSTTQPFIIKDALAPDVPPGFLSGAGHFSYRSAAFFPLRLNEESGCFLALYGMAPDFFTGEHLLLSGMAVDAVSVTLDCNLVAGRLQIERDFNREIVDSIHALLVSVGPGGQVLSLNRAAERIIGFSTKEVQGRYWVDLLLTPERRAYHQRRIGEALNDSNKDVSFQAPLRTRDGRERLIRWHGSIRDQVEAEGQVGLVLFGLDVTEYHATNQALDTALAQWENIFSAIQDPALIVDRQGVILDANPATLTAAKKDRDEVVGRQVCDVLHGGRQPGTTCPLEAFLATGKARTLETELRGLEGTYLLTLSPLQSARQQVTLLVARDLAEEEMIKAEALRAAQLVAIGELAAGVAHEINNPVNGIMNYAQLLLDDTNPDGAGAELLERIISESRRVSTIAHKLLDFARRREEHVEAASLALLINDCLDLIGHQLNKDGICLQKRIPENLPLIDCNAQQIQQVILNVLSNARYALNQKYPKANPDKRITISAEAAIRDRRHFVCLAITDHGVGIEQDIIARLFDPFFSTKPKGEGTGLGLSISHGIVKDHDGFLRISSQLGRSTTVVVELPITRTHGGDDA